MATRGPVASPEGVCILQNYHASLTTAGRYSEYLPRTYI